MDILQEVGGSQRLIFKRQYIEFVVCFEVFLQARSIISYTKAKSILESKLDVSSENLPPNNCSKSLQSRSIRTGASIDVSDSQRVVNWLGPLLRPACELVHSVSSKGTQRHPLVFNLLPAFGALPRATVFSLAIRGNFMDNTMKNKPKEARQRSPPTSKLSVDGQNGLLQTSEKIAAPQRQINLRADARAGGRLVKKE